MVGSHEDMFSNIAAHSHLTLSQLIIACLVKALVQKQKPLHFQRIFHILKINLITIQDETYAYIAPIRR